MSKNFFISNFEILVNNKGQFFIRKCSNTASVLTFYYRYFF